MKKNTEKIVWRSGYIGRNWFSHSTPKLVNLYGINQFVMIANIHPTKDPPAAIAGIKADTRERLWRIVTWKKYNIPISMAVQTHTNELFITGGYSIGCFGLKLLYKDNRWNGEYTFKDNQNCTSHIHTLIFHKNFLYTQSFDRNYNGTNGLICLSTKGELIWKSAPEYIFEYGSLIIADNKIFTVDGNTSELFMIAASPQKFNILGRFRYTQVNHSRYWAPLALSNGKLLIRTQTDLKCIKLPKNEK